MSLMTAAERDSAAVRALIFNWEGRLQDLTTQILHGAPAVAYVCYAVAKCSSGTPFFLIVISS